MRGPKVVIPLLLVTASFITLSCGESSAANFGRPGENGNPGGYSGITGVSGTGGILQTGGVVFTGGTNGGVAPTGGNRATGGGQTTGGSGTIFDASTAGTYSDGGENLAVGGMAAGGMLATDGSALADGNVDTGGVRAPPDANPPNANPPNANPTFHVFLLLGQSNMEGYPKAQAADRVENERIKVLGYDNCPATGRQTDQWDLASPPLHSCWNDGLGPGDYFAKTLIEVMPESDSIGLVPCAINGEKIETFMKNGGSKYNWIIQRAKLAQQAGGVIQGILFHQGESNNGDPSWPGKVNTLVEDIKSDLGLGQIPFLAGELLYSGGCAGHNDLIRQLPNIIANAYVVSAEGLVVDPTDVQWRLHFDHDSQVTFGKRYAEKMIEALGW